MDRRARLLGDLDVSTLDGLEIGAKHAPVVTRAEGRVRYVDYTDTESLRAAQYDKTIPLDQIVEVDIVWGGQALVEATGGPVDYVVASHVIEHLPDVVGWLGELRQVLKPGGTLGLTVPDKRFTFDILRPDSTLAELVDAYLAGIRQPSFRQIFEAASLSVPVEVAALWRGEVGCAPPKPQQRLKAFNLASGLRDNPRYIDAHCWVFTPTSFLDLAEALADLGLFPFAVAAFLPTEPGAYEFHLRLAAIDAADTAQAVDSIRRARESLRDTAAEPAPQPSAMLEARLAQALAERDALIASTSWRITAPLRALAGKLRRPPS